MKVMDNENNTNDIFLHAMCISPQEILELLSSFLNRNQKSLELSKDQIILVFQKNLNGLLKKIDENNSYEQRMSSELSFALTGEYKVIQDFINKKSIPSSIKYFILIEYIKFSKIRLKNSNRELIPHSQDRQKYLQEMLQKNFLNTSIPKSPYKASKEIIKKVLSSRLLSFHSKYLLQRDFFSHTNILIDFDHKLSTYIPESTLKTKTENEFHLMVIKLYVLYISSDEFSSRPTNSKISEGFVSNFPIIENQIKELIYDYANNSEISKIGIATSKTTIDNIIRSFFL
jgi:hypothetical protein|tara:strand:- start:495 stop:1355 length:861 start_codon:yes stop_codon:yes gene_type:complete